MRVQRSKLAPGMEVSENVVHQDGRLLIPAGTELTARHIEAFETSGVLAAEIANVTREELEAQANLPELTKNELERVHGRFRYVDLEGEFAAALLEEIVQRERRLKAQGKERS